MTIEGQGLREKGKQNLGKGVLADCMGKKNLVPKEEKRKGSSQMGERLRRRGTCQEDDNPEWRRMGAGRGQHRTLRTCPKES